LEIKITIQTIPTPEKDKKGDIYVLKNYDDAELDEVARFMAELEIMKHELTEIYQELAEEISH
jgi:hypothetical protein